MTPTMTTPTSATGPGSFTSVPAGYGPPPGGPNAYVPTMSTGASSPGSSVEHFEYNTAIDPALEVGVAPPPLPTPMTAPPTAYETAPGYRHDLKRSLDEGNQYPATVSDPSHRRGDTPSRF